MKKLYDYLCENYVEIDNVLKIKFFIRMMNNFFY